MVVAAFGYAVNAGLESMLTWLSFPVFALSLLCSAGMDHCRFHSCWQTVPVFFGNELEDGVLCAAPDRIMVTGLFPCGWLADRRQLHQIADRLWGRFSLKWPFSFDTCGRPHLPPETDLAAGGVPVCWLQLVLPVDETCELLILVLEYYGAKRCCRASICAGPSLLAVARFSGCLVLQFQHAAVLLDLWWPDAEYTVGFALAAEVMLH
ncbi:hypothetical protein Nepgr_020358 [Nepenthes gracilis]|uniref:Secreted protein n=1 Tax=Nepenthes gracilis TaxID=150966 RepID=A0AAD3SWW8_NEPGR|nr:hypothetical protein Nepgr_020358 [Nepenthes gracilis]